MKIDKYRTLDELEKRLNYIKGYEAALTHIVEKGELELNDIKYKLIEKETVWVVRKVNTETFPTPPDYFVKFRPYFREGKPFFWEGIYNKPSAYKFSDKEKAQAVATLIDGEAVEYVD